MINIDSRLLYELDANEMFLLLNLANRINEERFCFPGNKLLCNELKWSKEKLQQVKKRLEDKGFIKIEPRFKTNGPGQTSNIYRLTTPQVGNYTPGGKNGTGVVGKPVCPPVGESDTAPVGKLGMAPVGKPGNEVLINEALDTEVLINEELTKEKKRLFFDKGIVYKCLIECIWPELEQYAEAYIGYYDFPERLQDQIEEVKDPTIKKLLEKIWGLAEKLIKAFTEMNRPRPEFKDFKIIREGRKPGARDEAEYQIKAYKDSCRISGRWGSKDTEKLPEILIGTDWVYALHDLVKADIKAEKYDPAMDPEVLFSQWLVELYYWEPLGIYVCKRYNNRIVMDGDEYLHRKINEPQKKYGKIQ
jgi:hypothetical protein